MLQQIRPAVDRVGYEGERNSQKQEFAPMVSESNLGNTIEQIRLASPILKEMEGNGEIKIDGSLYDVDNGEMSYLE